MKHGVLHSIAEYFKVDYGLEDVVFEEEDFRFDEPPYREIHVIYYVNHNGYIVGSVIWLEPLQLVDITDQELASLECVGGEC